MIQAVGDAEMLLRFERLIDIPSCQTEHVRGCFRLANNYQDPAVSQESPSQVAVESRPDGLQQGLSQLLAFLEQLGGLQVLASKGLQMRNARHGLSDVVVVGT